MFLNSIGIILRKNELLAHKLTILDKRQGKIECVSSITSLSVGALIAYNMQQQNITYFISDITLIYIPLSLAQVDLLFLHHVIELMYYFTYVGNYLPEVFDLIAFLYSTEHTMMSIQAKKIFLLKLFISMDIMPEVRHGYRNLIEQLTIIDIQRINTITISLSNEKELDKWLWYCVWQHPYVNKFKTVHFLAKNRAL